MDFITSNLKGKTIKSSYFCPSTNVLYLLIKWEETQVTIYKLSHWEYDDLSSIVSWKIFTVDLYPTTKLKLWIIDSDQHQVEMDKIREDKNKREKEARRKQYEELKDEFEWIF